MGSGPGLWLWQAAADAAPKRQKAQLELSRNPEGPRMYIEKYRLQGRTAFVTGGGRGIGLAAAEALLEAGARVAISDRDADLLESGRAELARKGYDVETLVLDVTRSPDVASAAQTLNARHGGRAT